MNQVVEYITCTISANKPEFIFEVALSDNEIYRIKHHWLLGGMIKIPKSKYRFLADLADVLSFHILKELEGGL